ncbi:MAG: hypothetical protein ACLFTG_05730 [Alphaproteobacteria bacterium]
MTVVGQIVPALPPAVGGLGDYALGLALELRARCVASRFLTGARGCGAVSGVAGDRLDRRNGRALAVMLAGNDTVLAHVSGYGYARWGLCFWLADGLARWRGEGAGRRLVTVFHELYATGPVWRTSFWTSPAQRRIARRIAAASDAMIATSPQGAARLRAWEPNKRVAMVPVFSNVGELASPPPLAARAPVAVVFGGGHRARTWHAVAAEADAVGAALRALGVERVVDIGPPVSGVPDALAGLPVAPLGPLPAAEVSAQLADARAGLVDYPLHVLTKSGIVAAYLAHGTLCVNTSRVGELPADLAEGREFLHPARLAGGGVDGEAVAAAGHRWYRGHDVAATAALVHELIA